MNFPRLGVQNPQFSNVYEMERNAQANRPFAQLLNTGAKVIPAYIDQQKKEAEAQQLKDATNERNAFIGNYGQGFVGGLTSPQSFMPKMTELDTTAANQLMDARKANAPKAPAVQNLTDDKRAVYNSALQQLSSLRAAGVQPDDETYQRYEKLADAQEAELIKAGIIPASVREERIASKMAQTVAPVAGVEAPETRIESASNEALDIVKSAVDANSDGVIDNIVDLRKALNSLSTKYGINVKSPEWTAITGLLDTQEGAMKARSETAYSRGQQAQAEARQREAAGQSGGAIDKRAASQKIEDLQANPNDNTLLADATLWYMRKQSGAMIGPTEILQYMQGKLPEDKYKELVDELSPTGLRAIAGYVAGSAFSDPMVTKITAKYTPFIKRDRLIKDLNVYAQKDLGKKTAEAPKEESKLERIRRLREGKKQ